MQSCLEHAANGRGTVGLSRSEIVKNIEADRKRANMFGKFRARFGKPDKLVANVRILQDRAFHVIGMGKVEGLTLAELKVKLGASGYHAFKLGGLTFNLFSAIK